MNARKITMQSSGVRLFAASSDVTLDGARELENEALLLDELMTQRQNRELHDRRVQGIRESIKNAREAFASAIQNLDLSEETNMNPDRSMLDCAIHISLMFLELELYERIIEGRDVNNSLDEIKQIREGKWKSVVKNPNIRQYLGQLPSLTSLQSKVDDPVLLTS